MKFLLAFLIAVPCYARTIKIAVVDSGLNLRAKEDVKLCPTGHADFTGTGFKDNIGHGTNIAYVIADRLKDVDYCIVVVKVFDVKSPRYIFNPTVLGFLHLLNVNQLDVVNYSAGGVGDIIAEKVIIKGLLAQDVKFVCAAGNDAKDLEKNCDYYPACYSGVVPVGNLQQDGRPAKTSNYGKPVKFWEVGTNVCGGGVCLTGTSQATAVHTAKVARELSRRKK